MTVQIASGVQAEHGASPAIQDGALSVRFVLIISRHVEMTYSELSRLSFPQAFLRLPGFADHCDVEAFTPALERLEALFLQWPHLFLASGLPLEERRPGLWSLDTASGLLVFTFLTGEAHEVASVVFPAPERQIGLRAFWYWYRRRARDFWFCETDGWRRKDAKNVVGQRLVDRGVRPWLRFLPGVLPDLLRAARESLVRLALAWRGHSETHEFWERRDSQGCRELWDHAIQQDNHVLPCTAAVPFGYALRVVHYVPSLAVSVLSSRVVERAGTQARLGHAIEVVTASGLPGGDSQTVIHLSLAGIATRRAGPCDLDVRTSREIQWDLLRAVPGAIRERAFYATCTLLSNWPDALHCWSHTANLAGAVAGFATGVPRVVLHFLDELPDKTAGGCCSGLAAWYGILARSRRVQLLATSRSIAASWAAVTGVPNIPVSANQIVELPEDLPVRHERSVFGRRSLTDRQKPDAGQDDGQLPRSVVNRQQTNRGKAAA